MQDMLVRLYTSDPDFLRDTAPGGNWGAKTTAGEPVAIRRALAPERNLVLDWVGRLFSAGWVSETSVAFSTTPTKCHIAQCGSRLLGFSCFDATALGFLGPIGIDPAERGSGIGAALLKASLLAMREFGYAYAIIGGVGPVDFYARVAGATVIADSTPGVYAGLLRAQPQSSKEPNS